MPRPGTTRPREVFECVEPFAVFRDGIPDLYGHSRRVSADDPILRTHPGHFTPVTVEAMTAAPGEVRPVTIPAPPEPELAPDVPTETEIQEADNG